MDEKEEKIAKCRKELNYFVFYVRTKIVDTFPCYNIAWTFDEDDDEENIYATWIKVHSKDGDKREFYFGIKIGYSFALYDIEVIAEIYKGNKELRSEISTIYKGTYEELEQNSDLILKNISSIILECIRENMSYDNENE